MRCGAVAVLGGQARPRGGRDRSGDRGGRRRRVLVRPPCRHARWRQRRRQQGGVHDVAAPRDDPAAPVRDGRRRGDGRRIGARDGRRRGARDGRRRGARDTAASRAPARRGTVVQTRPERLVFESTRGSHTVAPHREALPRAAGAWTTSRSSGFLQCVCHVCVTCVAREGGFGCLALRRDDGETTARRRAKRQ